MRHCLLDGYSLVQRHQKSLSLGKSMFRSTPSLGSRYSFCVICESALAKSFLYRNFPKGCLRYAKNAVLFESSKMVITSENNAWGKFCIASRGKISNRIRA
jgi:hypothetical protein